MNALRHFVKVATGNMVVTMIIMGLLTGCSDAGDGHSSIPDSIANGEYSIDYENAELFEVALNNGEDVKGKVVKFIVNEYLPETALGINCHAGEHLNFISEEELEVEAGDVIIAYVSKEASKALGSWKINYVPITIEKGTEAENTEITETQEEKIEGQEETKETIETQGTEPSNLVPVEKEEKKEEPKKDVEVKEPSKDVKEAGSTPVAVQEVSSSDEASVNQSSPPNDSSYNNSSNADINTNNGESNKSSAQSGTNSVTVPSNGETGDTLVWKPTQGGTKYHTKASCSGMENPVQVTKEAAEAEGYTPCGKCYK